jgi:soluble lytic murein transglycosylase-like protein
MAALSVPIPMTPRTFYSSTALSQNKTKLERIGRTWYREIKQAETHTKVPGALILSVIFTESGGNPEARSSAGACGLMQLKPQTANDVIHLEHKTGRLTTTEKNLLLKHLGARLQGPLRQKYLSHKIPENNFSGNVITPQDLFIPELNVLLGSIFLGILIDQHHEGRHLRLDKVLLRYGKGYFFKPADGTVEQVLDDIQTKSKEGYAYILKVLGKNGLLETQSTLG